MKISLIITETQMKTIISYHFMLINADIRNKRNISTGDVLKKLGIHACYWWENKVVETRSSKS